MTRCSARPGRSVATAGSHEDATQEAFARALERWPRLREQPWVTGWVTSTALNAARRLQRRRWLHRAETAPMGIAAAADASGSVELWQVVRALRRRQREAVTLHYLVDLPVAEVVRLMGCRKGTVKAHLAHARKALPTGAHAVRAPASPTREGPCGQGI
jgi:RNA polymerase sigma factor (sigma-70 family)